MGELGGGAVGQAQGAEMSEVEMEAMTEQINQYIEMLLDRERRKREERERQMGNGLGRHAPVEKDW